MDGKCAALITPRRRATLLLTIQGSVAAISQRVAAGKPLDVYYDTHGDSGGRSGQGDGRDRCGGQYLRIWMASEVKCRASATVLRIGSSCSNEGIQTSVRRRATHEGTLANN